MYNYIKNLNNKFLEKLGSEKSMANFELFLEKIFIFTTKLKNSIKSIRYAFYLSRFAKWLVPSNWKYLKKQLFCKHNRQFYIPETGIVGCKDCRKILSVVKNNH